MGKGSEALVDTSACNTWELDPSTFSLEDSDVWQRWIQGFKQSVSRQLGVDSVEVQAELQNMPISETGAMLKNHTEWVHPPIVMGHFPRSAR